MKPQNYTPYHVHTMLSNGVTNIDSITDFHSYVNKAKEYGMTAFGFSEHGSIFAWLKKKEYIESCGMKYIHAVEAYLTEDNANSIKKIRDNYHIVLVARNYDGVKELNRMVSKSFNRKDYHFYYMPRITFEELFATSDNIIVTTACLGGVLHNGTSTAKEMLLSFLQQNKHRCFLEIQHHNVQQQIEYNQLLWSLSKEIDIPLIVGTDVHALNDKHIKGRKMLQMAKDVSFPNEDNWDLTFKSIDELVAAYIKQKSLPMETIYEAVENTNIMAEMVEPFTIDYSPKYPKLYSDSESVFQKKINEGVKNRKIKNYPNYKEYVDRIHYEYDVYKHNGAIDFMLLEENYKTEMRQNGIKYGYSRGPVSGSIIAYLLGITEIDSVKYNLNFERFMNKERVSLADVDTDWFSDDRKIVKDYLYNKDKLYCCDIVTFNTIALKGAIKDVCRGMYKSNIQNLVLPTDIKQELERWEKQKAEHIAHHNNTNVFEMPAELKKAIQNIYHKQSTFKEVPYDYLQFSESVIELAEKDEQSARKKYPEIFEYVDLVNGVVVSVGNHPAGCVVSPFSVDEWFGTFTTATNDYPISLLNMKEIDALNFVKLDILGLDNIGLIYKTCEVAGIPFATPDNIPPDDMNVWQSIKDDTTMIFQWESSSATDYLKQLFSNETMSKIKSKNPNVSMMDLFSIGNGAIRPAGASYREYLSKGIYQDNGHQALNDFLSSTLGYLVYQEQVIEFLHSFCGYTMGEADIVRRGFAKKTGTEQFIPKIKSGFIKTMKEKYKVSPQESEQLIINFIKVIADSGSYLFSKNHADPYSWIGYICGYLRYYYPLEFITTALNIFENKEDKSLAILSYANKQGIKISPIKFRHSIAEYSFDKESKVIFKGLSSIKYMNSVVANELYALRNNTYNTFIDVLIDLERYTSINSKQLAILIDLDFFEEFGHSNNLTEQNNLFNKFYGKKNFKKSDVANYKIPDEVMQKISEKETEKMFMNVDSVSLLRYLVSKLKVSNTSLSDKIQAQIKHLGYINIADERYSSMAAVLDIDTKYSPKLKLYSLKNGTTLDCKIDKKTFNKTKLKKGDIVRVFGTTKKPKVRKTADGKWEAVEGQNELWITQYYLVENI